MNEKSVVIPWISLSLLLQGMLFSFCSAFRCSISIVKHIFPCVIIAGAAVFLGVKLKKKYMLFAFSLVVLFAAIYAVFAAESLWDDFLPFVYYINKRTMSYNGTSWFGFEGKWERMDGNILLLLIGIFLALYIAFFAFRHCSRSYGLLPVYVVPVPGFCVGIAPDKKSVFFLAIGVVMAFSWISYQEKGGRHSFIQRGDGSGGNNGGRVLPYILLFLLLEAGFFGAQLLEAGTGAKILSHSSEYLKRQHRMERELASAVERIGQKIAGKFGIDSDGRLSNEAPVYLQDTVMKLRVSSRPVKSFYLKGFVGGDYENGRWRSCETDKLQEIVKGETGEMDIWEAGYRFAQYYQQSVVDFVSDDEDRLVRLKMEYVGKGRKSKYAYLPYYSDMYSVEDDEGNSCISMDGENGPRRKSDTYYVNCFNRGEDLSEMAGYLQGGNYLSMSAMQIESYNEYINELYARLPSGNLNQLRNLAKAYYVEDENAYVSAEIIRQILKQKAVYSQELEPVPAGVDYVEFFLYSQKKGYCEHFATAGTLLLRAKRIPARYVSGYKVPPERFVQNEDGTYTADVLDSDAHAWTEIFVGDASGWYPVDMTPDAESSSPGQSSVFVAEKTVPTDSGEKATEKPQATEPKQTEKPASSPEASAQAGNSGKKGKAGADGAASKEGTVQGIVRMIRGHWAAIILVVILFIVLIRRIVYPQMQRVKYDRWLRDSAEDANTFIQIRTGKFLFFLKHCGIRVPDKHGESQWIKKTADLCGQEFHQETWERIKEIVQEAEYAADSVTQEELQLYCDTVKKAEQVLYERQRKGRRYHLWLLGLKS